MRREKRRGARGSFVFSYDNYPIRIYITMISFKPNDLLKALSPNTNHHIGEGRTSTYEFAGELGRQRTHYNPLYPLYKSLF